MGQGRIEIKRIVGRRRNKKYLSAIETSYNDFLTKKHPSASSAVQENILRTNNNDIFGIEREGYLNHATKGIENLPESLRGNVHSLLWPVDMTNPVVHISNFQGLVLKPASVSSYSEHPGIDIQTFPGDKVFAVAEGVVVYVVDFLKENIDKKAFDLLMCIFIHHTYSYLYVMCIWIK